MQKIGEVSLKIGDRLIRSNIAYYSDDLTVTRFDIFDDPDKYDSLNTSNCLAAYYRDRKEYVYGDEEVIEKVLNVISTVSSTPGITTRESDFTGGVVTFVNKKECKDGSTYSFTTVNGLLSEEKYMTRDSLVSFYSVDQSSTTVIQPLTLNMYDVQAGFETYTVNDSSDLEYYTEEQLHNIYGSRMDHLYTYDFRIGENLMAGVEWLEQFKNSGSKLVSVDIESTGLETKALCNDCITAVGLAWDENHSMMFPFRQKGCTYNYPLWFLSYICDVLWELPKDCRVGTYNGKMEIESFWKERPEYIIYSEHHKQWDYLPYSTHLKGVERVDYTPTDEEVKWCESNKHYINFLSNPERCNEGIEVRSDVDGFHLSMKLDMRRGPGIHTLKTHSSQITGLFWLELEHIFKGEIKFDVLPPNLIRLYAGADPCNTIRVIKHLESKLPGSMERVAQIEHQLTYVKSENEFYGMRVDMQLLDRMIAILSYQKDLLERQFKKIHNTSKNIRSNDVKVDIFYNQLQAEVIVRTKTGAPSASKEALKEILKAGKLDKDKYDPKSVPDIVMYVDKNGIISQTAKEDCEKITILKGEDLASNRYPSLVILSKFNAICKELGALNRIKSKTINGRVTFYIISDGAESDRQTSDAHQYSNTMKKMILPDSDDHWLISCDYKQVELRVLAFVAQQQNLIEMEKDPEVDIHRAILSIITGKPIHLITDEERKNGKSTNFGVVYGMSEYGLAYKSYGLKATRDQIRKCAQDINDFYNSMPNVKRFVQDSKKSVLQDKKVKTAFGYIRTFNQIDDPSITKKQLSRAIKGGNNTRIQGFAATLMKLAENRYYRYIRQMGWDELVDCNGVMLPKVRMMLSIHDEVLISAHKSIPVAAIIKMCKVCQEISIKGAPPFFAAPAFVPTWYDGKDDANEVSLLFRDEIVDVWDKEHVNILDMNKYRDTLRDYHNKVMKDYMDSMIRQYKEPEEIAKHIDHPSITFDLLSAYGKACKAPTQEERILYAVKGYMAANDVGTVIDFVPAQEKTEDDELYELIAGDESDIGRYISFDGQGRQIVEYDDADTESEFLEMDEDDENTYQDEYQFEQQKEFTIYTMDSCLIDMTKIYRLPISEKVHTEIMEVAKLNPGEYRINYICGTKCIDTTVSVAYVPDKIDAIIQKYLDEEES